MKIFQINSVCGTGSTGKIATDLYSQLKKMGHDCKVAYGRGTASNIDIEDSYRIGSDFDVNFHALMTRITDKTALYSKSATRGLIKYIDAYNPDVIHLHNLHGYYVNIELLFDYIKSKNIKVIWTLHDCWTFTGHCPYFDYAGCEKWKTGCYDCGQKNSYPSSMIFDNSKNNYERKKTAFTGVKDMTLVTPSKWLADLVGESFLGSYPVKVVNNGINLDKFKPTNSDFKKKYNIADKKIILGVANGFGIRKGLNDFIKLSEIISDEWQIVMVGANEDTQKKLPSKIICIKHTNSIDELAQIYTASDVFLNPTYEDNFPTVNIEAIACGTPVVTYKTGGSPEMLNHQCGVVINKDKITDVIEALNIAISKSSDNCVNHAKKYSKEAMIENYIKLYGKGK